MAADWKRPGRLWWGKIGESVGATLSDASIPPTSKIRRIGNLRCQLNGAIEDRLIELRREVEAEDARIKALGRAAVAKAGGTPPAPGP